jgi:hypothetical protein
VTPTDRFVYQHINLYGVVLRYFKRNELEPRGITAPLLRGKAVRFSYNEFVAFLIFIRQREFVIMLFSRPIVKCLNALQQTFFVTAITGKAFWQKGKTDSAKT